MHMIRSEAPQRLSILLDSHLTPYSSSSITSQPQKFRDKPNNLQTDTTTLGICTVFPCYTPFQHTQSLVFLNGLRSFSFSYDRWVWITRHRGNFSTNMSRPKNVHSTFIHHLFICPLNHFGIFRILLSCGLIANPNLTNKLFVISTDILTVQLIKTRKLIKIIDCCDVELRIASFPHLAPYTQMTQKSCSFLF